MSGVPAKLSLPEAQQFYENLIALGKVGRFNPEDLLRLIAGECDFISVKNRYGFSGLTQIGVAELNALGWKGGEFYLADPAEQVKWSAKYFESWRRRAGLQRWESAAQMWCANLAPAHLNRVDGVVYSEKEHGMQYRANAWLDAAGLEGRPGRNDKVITLDDLDAALDVAVKRNQSKFDLAIKNLNIVKMQLALSETGRAPVDLPDLRDPWLSEVRFPTWPGAVTQPSS